MGKEAQGVKRPRAEAVEVSHAIVVDEVDDGEASHRNVFNCNEDGDAAALHEPQPVEPQSWRKIRALPRRRSRQSTIARLLKSHVPAMDPRLFDVLKHQGLTLRSRVKRDMYVYRAYRLCMGSWYWDQLGEWYTPQRVNEQALNHRVAAEHTEPRT